MLIEFLKRAWLAYVASVLGVSVVLGGLLSWTEGGEPWIFASLVVANAMMAGATMLFLGLPVAFWAWVRQQRKAILLGHFKATAAGLIGGIILHGAFLMCFGGFLLSVEIFLTTILCGGAYGAVFSLVFSLGGGLRIRDCEQAAAPNRSVAPVSKSESSVPGSVG